MDIPTLIVVAVLFSIIGAVVTLAAQRMRARPARDGQAAARNRQVAEPEKRLLAVMANAPIIVWAADRQGNITLLEGKGLEAWKEGPDPYIGQPVAALFPDSPQFAEHARKALAGEELTATLETPTLIYQAKFAPLKEVSGQPSGALGILIDITAWKRAEQELKARIEQLDMLQVVEVELSEILEINHVLALGLDAAMRLSQAHAGFIGLVDNNLIRVTQIIGNYPDSLASSFLSMEQGIIGRVLRRQQPELIRDVSADPDYQPYLPETRAQMTIPLVSQDRAIGVVNLETSKPERFTPEGFAFLQLVTARIAVAVDNARLYRQTQSQLEELQELYTHVSQLESMKTEMIRIASHDLRTPIGTISGYVNMLRMDVYDQLEPMQREFIEAIERGVQRMQTITEEILSLERIEEAARGDSAVLVNLNALVDKVFKEHEQQAVLKSQNLSLNTTTSPLIIEGDPVQLREAITNLIGNAIKYTPENGRVDVRLTWTGQEARFEVEDTGYGIPDDQQEGLFQPFFRAQTGETEEIEGTGLGLHLVKNIIERHKGRMIFRSVYGQGSTFGFELPGTNPPKSD